MQKGFTDGQAKLKAVWQNPAIASICSQMPNMSLLMTNTAAAMDKTTLSATDSQLLQRYARETHADYCAGCTEICESAIGRRAPIGDMMRFLMYCRSYGDRDHARAEYQKIPQNIRARITSIDYAPAEKKCPQKMAIARLMREAADELA